MVTQLKWCSLSQYSKFRVVGIYTHFIHSYSCFFLWSLGHHWNASFHFSFLIFRQSVGLLGRVIRLSQGHYLHRTTQTQKKRRQTSMPRLGFEPITPVFERAKTVHALDGAVTVIGGKSTSRCNIIINRLFLLASQYTIYWNVCRNAWS
jgi:hypothetical protein